eukprot:CAMPEP_0114428178 /NCGR_PEP_ID=MMETSP0103-20121206/8784_1 /TAXON_ID=37642 ORGANISM="Paraphysomonas imperforata, Strain PA2" /NCGR_SAMPLE_ID=MMETSP0103 /ASSEMBLY_ACC=CAM_ASM_000201 /LENGTH=301 /DNA_ID=CAMNT_0001597371 /DNA_START=215 /DNA_END=1120 /DNA_ORIENTATION=-
MHCRFRADHPTHGYVWKDMSASAPSAPLPTHNGVVLAKVLSLDSDTACLRRKSLLRRKQHVHSTDDAAFLTPAPLQGNKKDEVVSTQPKPVQHTQNNPRSSPPANQTDPTPPQPPAKEYNFFSNSTDDDDQRRPSPSPGAQTGSASSTQSAAPVTPAPVLNRADLASKRQHDIDDKVAAALAEKKERDEKQAQEEQERDDAKDRLDNSLTAWAFDNGKKRNVRTLLATMHTVVWEGCKWKPIGLGDVLSPKQVKLAYRKAMLVVHTDKCAGMDTETKFIAMRLFTAINEAYEEFLEKEGGV